MPPTAVHVSANPVGGDPLPGGERLARILASAASFSDRLDGVFFAPAGDDAEAHGRVTRWLDAAAPAGGSAREALMARAGSERMLAAGLRRVCLRDPRQLPDWARALTVFLGAQPADAGHDPVHGQPGALLSAIARGGERLLDDGGVLTGVEVAPAAREQIVSTLDVRLWELLRAAVEFELRLSGMGTEESAVALVDGSLDGWLRRMEMLPGIAYVLGLTCHQWQRSIGEVFVRLRADRDRLREDLWGGDEPGALVAFTGDAGDRHNRGRAVALLEFASGAGAVYKPKDLSQTRAFMDLLTFLNGRGLTLELATRRIIVREGYSWEERIRPRPCPGPDGFRRFYHRLGMLTRVVQLLEGRDLWADNLLAAGEHPQLIDLECLLYPRVSPPPAVASRRELLRELDETVVRTGMVVQPWVPSDDLPVRDLGCLSHAGDADGERRLPLPPYRPWSGGQVADPWAYGAEVIAGYREMHDVLVGARAQLCASDGPLRRFHGVEVRYIWRHTWECQNIVRASVVPRALRDGAEREIILARVLRDAYTVVADEPARVDLAEIADAEVEAFRELDIPLFLVRTDSTSPYTTTDSVAPGHFAADAWTGLQERLDALGGADLDRQIAVLTTCLDAARHGAETVRPASGARAAQSAGATSPSAPPTVPWLLAAATEVASTLLGARGERSGWLGLSWYPVPDLYQVEVAGSDLLTGGGAIAVFLAELSARTGESRHRAGARAALDEVLGLVGDSFAYTTNVRLAGGAPVPGGFAGPGAAMHALARCGAALGDARLIAAAHELLVPARRVAGSAKACADAPFGVAGLLLNALATRAAAAAAGVAPAPAVDELVAELAERSLTALTQPDTRIAPYAASSRLADLTPIGRDSIAAALARTVIAAPELAPDSGAIRAGLQAHRTDTRRRGGRLAAHAIAAAVGKAERGAPASPTTGGRSGRELIAAARELHAGGRRPEALRVFAALARRRARFRSWFPDRWADDRLNLSAVDGLTAVGLLSLELLEPETSSLTLLG